MRLELILRHDEEHDEFHERIVQRLELDPLRRASECRDHFRHAVARCVRDRDAKPDARAHRLLAGAQRSEHRVAIRPVDLPVRDEQIHKLGDCRIAFGRLHLREDRFCRKEIA